MKFCFFVRGGGQEDIAWNIFLERVKEAGYDGIEASLPLDAHEKKIL
jgi:sugar phosphate isomerase/epimerase